MTSADRDRRRAALTARFADGEIDKATLDQMLADLEKAVAAPPMALPQDDLDRLATVSGQAPARLAAGTLLGGFRLESCIGRGGMGEVWKAHDPTADRYVAVKVVPPDVQRSGGEMARVKDTFRRIHALHHQHVCPLYLLGDDPLCGYFVVMQFIDGEPLSVYRRRYAAEHGAFPLAEAVRLLSPVAAALDYAHAEKVIHRDIKPDNILVVGGGRDVQVIDFGLAAEIHSSMGRVSQVQMDTSGTRPYMAPEQWRGQYQDAWTDQYALGVVAYELLSGRLPFDAPDAAMMRLCVLQDPPLPIEEQPEHVNQALVKAMAKGREERFGSCREFIAVLGSDGAAGPDLGEGVAAAGAPAPEQSPAIGEGISAAAAGATPSPQGPSLECPACGRRLRVARKHAGRTLPCPACKALLQVLIEADRVLLRSAGPAAPRVLEQSIANSIGMKLVLIAAGEFMMGSPAAEQDVWEGERPQHRVRITRPFYLGACPVTQAQYKRIMGNNPSHFKESGGDAPVESVSWDDAREFCQRLGQVEGKTYRLPTEAEWEYACRAGGGAPYCCGDDDTELSKYAWYDLNSGGKTHPVGEKKPNAWGLYDMHGNVYEWCADWYESGYYAKSPAEDPAGPSGGSHRVYRGGAWLNAASFCRSGAAQGAGPGSRTGTWASALRWTWRRSRSLLPEGTVVR